MIGELKQVGVEGRLEQVATVQWYSALSEGALQHRRLLRRVRGEARRRALPAASGAGSPTLVLSIGRPWRTRELICRRAGWLVILFRGEMLTAAAMGF